MTKKKDPRIDAMKDVLNQTDDYDIIKEIGDELFFNDPKPKKSFTQLLKEIADKNDNSGMK